CTNSKFFSSGRQMNDVVMPGRDLEAGLRRRWLLVPELAAMGGLVLSSQWGWIRISLTDLESCSADRPKLFVKLVPASLLNFILARLGGEGQTLCIRSLCAERCGCSKLLLLFQCHPRRG